MKTANPSKTIFPSSTNLDLSDYFGNVNLYKASELFDKLNEPLIKGIDTGIVQRNLSYWVKTLQENTTGNKHKKYSFVEFIWLKTVEQLRTVNVEFDLIRSFKAELLKPIKISGLITKIQQAINYVNDLKLPKEKANELLNILSDNKNGREGTFTMLHMIIIDSIINKLPLSIAVFSDGTYQIIDKSKEHLYTNEEKSKLLFDTYINVSISKILKEFLYSDLSGFIIPELGLFSYAENKLFEVVHSGEYETITIHFKDKKIKSLELKKSEDIKQKIIDILNKDEFGEILVKKHKGIVTKIENTIKINL